MVDTYSKHSLDKQQYKNKMILIIGGGNSAFEVGDHLSGAAAIVHIAFNKRIQFAWDTHYVGNLVCFKCLIDQSHVFCNTKFVSSSS